MGGNGSSTKREGTSKVGNREREVGNREEKRERKKGKITKQSQQVLCLQYDFCFIRFIFAQSGNTDLRRGEVEGRYSVFAKQSQQAIYYQQKFSTEAKSQGQKPPFFLG